MVEKTMEVKIPEGSSEEDIQKVLKQYEKQKARENLKKVPYIGYSCGKTWIVGGTRYSDAHSAACGEFIEEFANVLPENVTKERVAEFVGVRKLGEEYRLDIKDSIEYINNLSRGKRKVGRKDGNKGEE